MFILFFIEILEASSVDCQNFTSPTDCDYLKPLCSWIENSCFNGYVKPQIDLYAQQLTSYCSQQNQAKCAITFGCSFYNDKCIRFLGCDAYQSYSDQDCVRISYLCMWNDEKQGCVRSPYYDNDGNVIKQRTCSEALYVWRSKEGCPKYSSQCIFNGIECTEYLSSCSQYSTTKENCNQLIGVDGECEYQNYCKAKICTNYNSNNCIQYRLDCYLNQQRKCEKKQNCERNNVKKKSECLNTIEQNCYFDGRTCSQKSLKQCSEQSQELCQGIVGRDGICILQNQKCIISQCYENNQYQVMEIYNDYCQWLYVCEQKNSACTQIKQEECSNIFQIQKDCQCYQCSINKQECVNAISQQECIQNKQLNSNIPCYWNQDQNICLPATKCQQLQNKSSCQQLKPSCVFRNSLCLDVLEIPCTQITDVEKGEGIIEKYCLESRGCSILNNQCITLQLECGSYTSYSTCFKNLYNQPCVWNQDKRQCLRYRERELLKKNECETISNLWIYQDESCQIRKHCSLLNETQIGLEGNCALYNLEQLQSNLTTCNGLVLQDCNKFKNKCYFDLNKSQCRNLECSDLNSTSCKPIQAFTISDYKYCRLFGEICIETLPMNEKDCILYSGGSKIFIDNYCVLREQDDQCLFKFPPNFQSDSSEFQTNEDVIVKKLKLSNANFVLQYGEPKFDTKQLMQSEAQRIFNQYSQIVKDEKRPQVFGFINQQTNAFLKRMEEHRQILKSQIELQIKICQGNILLQKALLSYDQKK